MLNQSTNTHYPKSTETTGVKLEIQRKHINISWTFPNYTQKQRNHMTCWTAMYWRYKVHTKLFLEFSNNIYTTASNSRLKLLVVWITYWSQGENVQYNFAISVVIVVFETESGCCFPWREDSILFSVLQFDGIIYIKIYICKPE